MRRSNKKIPVDLIIQQLKEKNANFDLLEEFLQESIDREKAIIDLTSPILSKGDIYDKKIAIYEVQILLTAIRNRHLTS